ncbi:glycoside hydrolase family 5 protein [Collybiopsis luxurians FD-317 M1]|uniref:glucan 1,3-beta-glucosidase n=1 Tax=Collybiopsis luxurians FD-317 M1 TaxID=944289 RepID=A0A0D0BMT5_9AGAR|nr:glycoside hydrolase family 5 protein [Collybiopsis luxurians FD-317 M1]
MVSSLFNVNFRTITIVCTIAAVTHFAQAISPGFTYGGEKVRGVNIGGWLVLEPWITPSLFDKTGNNAIVDEWTFGKYQDHSTAKAALKAHWDSWITERDFADIAAAGLNHVRIPIGYWAFEVGPGEPYISGQLPYLQKAIGWASNHGLKVIVDLHGVPGSQNGFDNSGQRLSFPTWQQNNTNVERSNNVIKTIAGMFTGNPNVVTIISPLNEPAGFDGDQILSVTRQFYRDSYGNIRYPSSSTPSNTVVLLHDAYQAPSYWNGFLTESDGGDGVAFDTHIYQMFSTGGVAQSEDDHIKTACSSTSTLEQYDLWVIVGEWTPAMTDCAKYLNGRGIGARYDGTYPGSTRIGSCNSLTGSGSSFSGAYKKFLRKSWDAQTIAFEKGGQGWVMWAWKAENADDWSYQAGLKYGWIPTNPADHEYADVCE